MQMAQFALIKLNPFVINRKLRFATTFPEMVFFENSLASNHIFDIQINELTNKHSVTT
jgi:hypothetical protein